jgi:hypothetical protein
LDWYPILLKHPYDPWQMSLKNIFFFLIDKIIFLDTYQRNVYIFWLWHTYIHMYIIWFSIWIFYKYIAILMSIFFILTISACAACGVSVSIFICQVVYELFFLTHLNMVQLILTSSIFIIMTFSTTLFVVSVTTIWIHKRCFNEGSRSYFSIVPSLQQSTSTNK